MKFQCRELLLGLVSGGLTTRSLAQSNTYPNKPVRIHVPFPPGGSVDNQARVILTRVSQALGQPFVFEDIAGAGGNLGCQRDAHTAADDHTLRYGTNGTHGINHALHENPGFDPQKDFQAVGRLSSLAAMLVVRPDLPVNHAAALIALLKARPGAYSFGSAGYGTTSHLAGEIFEAQAGLFAVHVPYRGGAAALVDLMGSPLGHTVYPGRHALCHCGKSQRNRPTGAGKPGLAQATHSQRDRALPQFCRRVDAICRPRNGKMGRRCQTLQRVHRLTLEHRHNMPHQENFAGRPTPLAGEITRTMAIRPGDRALLLADPLLEEATLVVSTWFCYIIDPFGIGLLWGLQYLSKRTSAFFSTGNTNAAVREFT